MDSILESEIELQAVLAELTRREPIFHRPEFGNSRADFEQQTDHSFWEVGASGRKYSRNEVLDILEVRHANPVTENWEAKDFQCLKISEGNYLLTYTLVQHQRITQRATIWRRTDDGWKILYHQGTMIEQRTT